MSVRGIVAVLRVEIAKIAAQLPARIALLVCIGAPLAFVAGVRLQSTVPEDTLFGRAVNETGFATPLVLLGFSGFWALPALASVVSGDLFSSEDRFGTWSTVLTRGRRRAETFTGKVVAAIAFSWLAITVLAVCSIMAGTLVVGTQPLVDLSGQLLLPRAALLRTVLAWATVLPPVAGFACVAVLCSAATRNGAAGVGLPVIGGLVMRLTTLVNGPDSWRQLLLTTGFDAWHGLLVSPPYYRPIVNATFVSVGYVVVSMAIAYASWHRRDIGP